MAFDYIQATLHTQYRLCVHMQPAFVHVHQREGEGEKEKFEETFERRGGE